MSARAVLDKVTEDRLVVVADDEDFVNLGNFGDRGEAVGNDGMAGDFEERLRTDNQRGAGLVDGASAHLR